MVRKVENAFEALPTALFSKIMKYCEPKDNAIFGRVNRESYIMTRRHLLDTVHYIAWRDINDNYHVQYLSSAEKKNKKLSVEDLKSMTYINEETKETEYLLTDETINDEFDWSMFIHKQHRGIDLQDTKGYFKLLDKEHYKIHDMQCIKLLLLHKELASDLLNDVNKNKNPFKQKITIFIHREHIDNSISKYDVLFWNGASPNQTHTLQIYDHQTERNRFYMHFKSHQNNIKWHWYDNDSSRFREYTLGFRVTAQIECSFQANLLYNFPLKFHKNEIFNRVNLTQLRLAYMKEFGRQNKDKVFVLRLGFDEQDIENREIVSAEQITVTSYAFARNILRLNSAISSGANDFCHGTDGKFNLRMKGLLKCESDE